MVDPNGDPWGACRLEEVQDEAFQDEAFQVVVGVVAAP